MRSGVAVATRGVAALRLLLCAVLALMVLAAPMSSSACPMGASSPDPCACPCCDLTEDDTVRRTPCCVKQASADAPQPTFERREIDAQAFVTPPVATTIALPLPPRDAYSTASSLACSTGPPVWLLSCSLLR